MSKRNIQIQDFYEINFALSFLSTMFSKNWFTGIIHVPRIVLEELSRKKNCIHNMFSFRAMKVLLVINVIIISFFRLIVVNWNHLRD